MFPIYFNAVSHLWIAYLFFVNGLLLHYLFRAYSENYKNLTTSFEAHFLAAFCLSLSVNGLLLLCLDLLGLAFANATYILPILSVGLTVALATLGKRLSKVIACEFGFARVLLYLSVFILLFYNGGLIEKIADSWWHMSLANKIGLASSFELEYGHLNGVSSRYYPPLWHGNLALANVLSGISIPIFWNSFTAWGAALKVMAFFLFAYSLSKDRAISFISAALFLLLPGIGDSYMRVSAWPSHIAYTIWFAAFYVCFSIADKLRDAPKGGFTALIYLFRNQFSLMLVLVMLGLLILFTHQTELLWLVVGLMSYLIGLSIYHIWSRQNDAVDCQVEDRHFLLTNIYRLLLLAMFAVSVWFICREYLGQRLYVDRAISYTLPVFTSGVLLYLDFFRKNLLSIRLVSLILCACLIAAIDLTHLASFFVPGLALPKQVFNELPLIATGYFGGLLDVPGWHHHLRPGLLYSGVLSILLSIIYAIIRPSRLSIFLASNCVVGILFCLSPYLHHWLRSILAYHSTWRISVLIFHPIVIASVLVLIWQNLMAWKMVDKFKRASLLVLLIGLLGLIVRDSMPHFDRELVYAKRQNLSAQRNWNFFYDQRYVFNESTMRYTHDLNRVRELVEPHSVVLSDLSTSYYVAATLPVYVRNIHRHHGLRKFADWHNFLGNRYICDMHKPQAFDAVKGFVQQQFSKTDRTGSPEFRYVIVNKDKVNKTLRSGCFWHRGHIIIDNIESIAKPLYNGEFLSLYELSR